MSSERFKPKSFKVAYSCNDYYIPQTGISIISLCENNKDADEIIIYFIGKDVSEKNIEILREITEIRYSRTFVYVSFDDIAFDLNISAIGRHIETIYTKVFFSRIEGLDKVIYLDSDTVINGSLQPLWDDNLSGVYMGVVQTFSKKKEELGLPKDAPFFNDGMAIINVDYCREHNLIEKVLKVVEDYNGNPPTLSEGALNKVCYGNVKYISLRWNCMAGLLYLGLKNIKWLASQLSEYTIADLEESCKNPVVVHYLTAFYNRPWFTPCSHPYKDLYFKYQSMSPWKENKPSHKELPTKIKWIKACYSIFGVEFSERLRVWLGLV